jgi:hypothetical protein
MWGQPIRTYLAILKWKDVGLPMQESLHLRGVVFQGAKLLYDVHGGGCLDGATVGADASFGLHKVSNEGSRRFGNASPLWQAGLDS